jgi:NTE family protein
MLRRNSLVLLAATAILAAQPVWQWERAELDSLRPQIVLVLSGGGARGIAQIGVLQTLHRAGILPDAVVGSSIGAILGGLYASGYSPEELEELVRRTDWNTLLALQEQERRELFVEQKLERDRSLLTLYFENFRPILPLAVVTGSRITAFLEQLLWNAPYQSSDFDRLRCRFRAVATDLLRGESIALNSGDLALALRASASFPLRYPPVQWDSLLLVDGGLKANLPVRLARRLFPRAILIAVNTVAPLRSAEELTSPWAVADQSVSLLMQSFVELDRAAADVLIEPELGRHGTLEFSNFDTLLTAGRLAAARALPQLRERLQRHWDSVALHLAQPLSSGRALPLSALQLEGFAPEDRQHLLQLQGQPLARALAEILQCTADGCYRRLACSASVNGAAVELICHAQPYEQLHQVEFEGDSPPAAVSALVEASGAALSECPRHRWHTETLLRTLLHSFGKRFVQVERWEAVDSCLVVRLHTRSAAQLQCIGLSATECAELQGLLRVHPGQQLPEDFLTTWNRLRNSGLFRALELRAFEHADSLLLQLHLWREPSQRLHIGIRSDNERFTRLWLEALHHQGLSWRWELRLQGMLGPRDAAAALGLSLHRLFPDIWASARMQLYASQQLLPEFTEEPSPTGWRILTRGELLQQRIGALASISFPFQPNGMLESYLRLERQREYPSNGTPAPFYKVLLWGASFRHDDRDRAEFPTTGQLFALTLEGSLPGVREAVSFSRAHLHYERATRLQNAHTLTVAIEFGAGDATMPSVEFFSLGGLHSFLGMREEQWSGRQLLRTAVEYAFSSPIHLWFPTSVFARWNVGSVWALPEQIRLSELRHGIGIGIVLETPIGLAQAAIGRSFRFFQTGRFLRWGPTLLYFSIGSHMP